MYYLLLFVTALLLLYFIWINIDNVSESLRTLEKVEKVEEVEKVREGWKKFEKV